MRDSAGCMEGLLCPHQVAQAGKHMQSSLLWVGAAGPLTADLQLSTGLHAALSACIPTLSACIPQPLNLPLNCGSCLPTLWLADMQLSGVSLPANVATSAEASLSALPRSQQLTLPPDLLCPAACSEHASLSASEGCRNGSPERHPPVLWAGSVIPPAHPLDAVLCSTAATLRRITAPSLPAKCSTCGLHDSHSITACLLCPAACCRQAQRVCQDLPLLPGQLGESPGAGSHHHPHRARLSKGGPHASTFLDLPPSCVCRNNLSVCTSQTVKVPCSTTLYPMGCPGAPAWHTM